MSDARIKLSDGLLRLAHEAWSVRQRATGDVTDAISALIDERIAELEAKLTEYADRLRERDELAAEAFEEKHKRIEELEAKLDKILDALGRLPVDHLDAIRDLRDDLAASERALATARADALEDALGKMLTVARGVPNDVFTQAFRVVRELGDEARAKAAAAPGPEGPGCGSFMCESEAGRLARHRLVPTDALDLHARLDADGTATGKTILTAPVVTSAEGASSAGPATTLVDTGTGERTGLDYECTCRVTHDGLYVHSCAGCLAKADRLYAADAPNPYARLYTLAKAWRDTDTGDEVYRLEAEVDRLRAAEGGAK